MTAWASRPLLAAVAVVPRSSSPRKLTAVDLFCGAGGLSHGLRSAGIDVTYAIDAWAPAVETYANNLGAHVTTASVDWSDALPPCDLIVGGPPCQGFSSAGRRAPGDARNTLVAVFAHLVATHRPRAFLFENVEGFLTGDGGRWVVDLVKPLVAAGYCVSLRKVNAANYGVPQNRKRVIVVGGLGWNPGLPSPTHRAVGIPGAENVAEGSPLAPTVMDALAGLPDVDAAAPSDHVARRPSEADLARIAALAPGQTMKDLPEALWHDTYRRRANRRVKDGTPTERRGGAPAGLRRLEPDQPSKAITSGAISEFVHPTEDRTLTLRECARIQTFEDDFEFAGTKAQRALQIGNAVPPRFAAALAHHLAAALRARKKPAIAGLHEFTPTFSTGMSPALARTVELVESVVPQIASDDLERQLRLSLAGDACNA